MELRRSNARSRWPLSLVLVAASCGSDLTFAPASEPEPESNDIVIATVRRCTEAVAPTTAPELPFEGRRKEFFSTRPLAQMQNLGGRTLPSPRIIGVFLGEDKMRQATEALLQSYGCTSYWRDAVNEYGIGDALYDKTVTLAALPPPVLARDAPAFEAWVRDNANTMFGALSEQHVLMFFLPPTARLGPDDCDDRVGRHDVIVTPDGKRIPYAYFATCTDYASPNELARRTGVVTRALIEIATDPDPSAPAWKGLGPGIVPWSLRTNTLSVDSEGAAFCHREPALAPDYPFEVARNYSNRRARAGLNPCDPVASLAPIAALSGETAIDLSSGRAHIVLDIFAEDRSKLTLSAEAYLTVPGGSALVAPLLEGSTLTVRDGDAVPLDLHLSLSAYIAPQLAQVIRTEVEIDLCPPGPEADCGSWRFPISHLPPVEEPPDAGIEDAGEDG